jgi:transcriptional regulator with XRE-family HTH domain
MDMDWYGMTDGNILFEIGKRIKQTRKRKRYSQAELAERAGISSFTVSQMENGKNTSLGSLIAVMRILRLLENFESLIPEPMKSPVELYNRKAKRNRE